MVKDWVLEQKKGFWSMIKGWKDLEHDLELIEDKNMKILCKNIRHGRAWQWRGRAKVPGCYFELFLDLKAHGLLALYFLFLFLGLKLALGYK